jgi:hypothetical protein
MNSGRTARTWESYSGGAGLVFVVALIAEIAVSVGIPLNQDDSAAKIARELASHHRTLIVVACLSIVYAVAFLIYLWRLHWLFHQSDQTAGRMSTLVLAGGILFVTLHAVSDIGVTGMLGAKVATYSALHDHGISYTLYLTTFAVDSVGDVLGSLFVVTAGLLVFRTAALPRWLGYTAMLTGILFFLQGFGLGGVIAQFGLILDLVGFVLLIVFVAASSVVMVREAGR